MSKKYKFLEATGLHFVTATTVGWVDLFTRKPNRDILVDCLKWCQENKELHICAYVIMTNHLHMVAYTDGIPPGLACNFVQHGIELPCSANYSIPNFPNYRLGTGQPVCDSSIVYVSSGEVPPPPVQGVRVWPNPASVNVTVSLPVPLPQPATWSLCDALGRQVARAVLSAGQREVEVGLAGVPPGLFFWQVSIEGRQVGSGKLVISNH
ncbi:MAG: T9SS type A sorting domain-containing protein [Bacteroidetes bacterium]|nr:T9SS type A sorting domain-containing protein [Bacteroidota bacterium]